MCDCPIASGFCLHPGFVYIRVLLCLFCRCTTPITSGFCLHPGEDDPRRRWSQEKMISPWWNLNPPLNPCLDKPLPSWMFLEFHISIPYFNSVFQFSITFHYNLVLGFCRKFLIWFHIWINPQRFRRIPQEFWVYWAYQPLCKNWDFTSKRYFFLKFQFHHFHETAWVWRLQIASFLLY